MNLYQYNFGHRPHYVVADSYGEAERVIKEHGYSAPKTITCLVPNVLVQGLEEPHDDEA